MNEEDFEGTLVLEKLASIDLLDAFYEAIDLNQSKTHIFYNASRLSSNYC